VSIYSILLIYDVNALDSFVLYNHTIIIYNTEKWWNICKICSYFEISNNDIWKSINFVLNKYIYGIFDNLKYCLGAD